MASPNFSTANLTSGGSLGGATYNTGLGGLSSASAVSSLLPALTGLLGIGAYSSQLESQTKAMKANMKSEIDSFKFNANVIEEQLIEVDRAVGDKMTERGVTQMQRRARAIAGGAETGTSGGTQDLVINDEFMQQSLDDMVIIQEGRRSTTGMLRNLSAQSIGLNNRLTTIASGISSPSSAFLGTVNAGLSGFTSGLSMLNSAQLDRLYQTDKGTK